MKEQEISLKSACCACLTELVLNDTNAHQIVQANGVYYLGLLILPQECLERTQKYVRVLQVGRRNALLRKQNIFLKIQHWSSNAKEFCL